MFEIRRVIGEAGSWAWRTPVLSWRMRVAHGLFAAGADTVLGIPAIERVVVCDSVPPFRVAPAGALRARLRVVTAVPLFRDAIRASHSAWRR